MSKVRIVFLGTPEFAVTCLKGLVRDEHFDIVGVVTQPDRPAGRKMQLLPSPVKNYCVSHKLRVISPDSVNEDVILGVLDSWSAEIAIVVAFGQLLNEKFLKIFPLGAVNVHASLLPRWRGAAPIQRAIEAGDAETGVCLQKIVRKLDAGDVLGFRKLKINDDMDAQKLHDQLALLSSELLSVELMDYVRGNLTGEVQNEAFVTYAKKIEKAESQISWNTTARSIFNKVRAFSMGPHTWSFIQTPTGPVKIKIHRVEWLPESSSGEPGRVHSVQNEECLISTKDGIIRVLEVQPESRNRMSIKEYIKGYGLQKGDLFF